MEEQNKQHHQRDVVPGEELDQLVNQNLEKRTPETNGTGANRPVQTEGTVIINDDPSSPKK